MQNKSDTLPFTNRFNYLVKEISAEEFLTALSQFEADEEANSNKQIQSESEIRVHH